MLLTDGDREKAIKNGFREDLIDSWDGGPYVLDLKLFTAPKGTLRIQRFKTKQDLVSRLYRIRKGCNFSSHCLLALREAGIVLSPQQDERANVREQKNALRIRKKKK